MTKLKIAAIFATLILGAGAFYLHGIVSPPRILPPVPSNTWAAGPDMSGVRTGACAVKLPDNQLLVIGGLDAGGNPLNTAEILLPGAAQVPEGTPPPASAVAVASIDPSAQPAHVLPAS